MRLVNTYCDTLLRLPIPYFFKPILFLTSNSFSGFRQGISHFFTARKNTTERIGEEQTNKHGLGSTPSARKGKSICDNLHSPCICRLTLACILHETSTKGTNNADIFSRWFNGLCVVHQVLAVVFLTSVDSVIFWIANTKPIAFLCPPLSTASLRLSSSTRPCLCSDLPFLLHFRSRQRSRVQALCLGFVLKQTKRLSARRTIHIVSQYHLTQITFKKIYMTHWQCYLWWNGFRKWKKRYGLKTWMRLFAFHIDLMLWCWPKKDTRNSKGLIEKHIYSSKRNKIQVNLLKQ